MQIARILEDFGSLAYSVSTRIHAKSKAAEALLLREVWTFSDALDNLAVIINSVLDCLHCSSTPNVLLLDGEYQQTSSAASIAAIQTHINMCCSNSYAIEKYLSRTRYTICCIIIC